MSDSTISRPPASLDPPFPVRRFSVEEYHRMGEAGVLTEDDQVELLEGLVVPKMIRKPVHDAVVELVRLAISRVLPTGWCIRGQSAITTADSEPEPDIAVVRGTPRDYLGHHPRPADVALVVEIAETSLDRDRKKRRIYAQAGIPYYWIVNLPSGHVEIHANASSAGGVPGYEEERVFGRTSSIPLIVDGKQAGEIPAVELLP
jgi:Uma2 family endonuclease